MSSRASYCDRNLFNGQMVCALRTSHFGPCYPIFSKLVRAQKAILPSHCRLCGKRNFIVVSDDSICHTCISMQLDMDSLP